jgi:replicative DNA helicase
VTVLRSDRFERPEPARSALDALAALHDRPPARRTALPSGLGVLDEVLDGGVRPGELALLVGKPAVGKTILALQWARYVARSGAVAVYACYEHDEATLLGRLLASELGEMVEEGDASISGVSPDTLVECAHRVGSSRMPLADAVASHRALAEASRRVARYADRLVLAASSRLTVAGLAEVVRSRPDVPVVLFVDYLQKVPVPGAEHLAGDRVVTVAEELKTLALEEDIAIVGITAVDQVGLAARRVHGHHARGASSLAYESDVVVVLNEKLDIVSRAHLADSPTRSDEFRHQVVFSVEKHRRGVPTDLEFDKDFVCSRFDSTGRWVAERLWTEGSFER